MTRRSIIAGTGAALPARKLSNDELAAWKNIDSTDVWIVERTGIRTRHFAGEGETTATLATLSTFATPPHPNAMNVSRRWPCMQRKAPKGAFTRPKRT